MKILCIIPARSGSKGIPDKNIKFLLDKPLIAWSIEQAKNTKYYKEGSMRIIVSTDSEKYKQIALKYGAEVPFIRPDNISQDTSIDIEFINHAVKTLKMNEDYTCDYILQLRPTQPCRSEGLIDDCLDKFIGSKFDSLRTVIPVEKTPYKMYKIDGDELVPLFKNINGITESYNIGRQYLPKTYLHNGYVDILKPKLLEKNMISGNILAYEMGYESNIDIDSLQDWEKAENFLNLNL